MNRATALAVAPSSPWEKPWGPLPLSLSGTDAAADGQEEEGPTGHGRSCATREGS